jgi:hypothetical protein
MNRTISGLMLALLAIAGAAPSFAADRERGAGARQQFSQPRVQQGMRSGEATRSMSGSFQRGTNSTRQFEQRSRGDGQLAQSGQRERFQGFNRSGNEAQRDRFQGYNRPDGNAQRERHDGNNRWAGRHDQNRNGQADHRRWANNDHFRDGDRRHYGWDHNRGRQSGWDNNRGNHYGWANNRGRHNGWDNNRGNHYGWSNDRGRHYGNQGRPAYGWDRSIDRRQEHQRERIVQGMRSGELTRHEAQRLFSEQRDLRQQERAFRSDGMISQWERREMHRDLNDASRHIYNQTHDAQERF